MKNIILLSDGTGNGAAKRNQTNVWRLYSALNLHRPDQIACYDDGVGSQEFKPLKLLGGAFGWGLKRNVLDLYKFLCRNFENEDKIYLFGFSRGAFTVRVLAGMIDRCGLYTNYSNESDLHQTAKENFTAYRSEFYRGYLYRFFRWITKAEKKIKGGEIDAIEFIGVWDTVDAYGFPIDEIAILWDRYIFPIRFPNRQLSHRVKKACHALSINDERNTFHPVLWDERNEATLTADGSIEANRLEQVWFPGAHSDVGGGYPRYTLSLVTLDWMISKVEAKNPENPKDPGLRFIETLRDEYMSRSDWHGVQHDSRSGLAVYYRYKPRNIKQLCDNPDAGVLIDKPKIHRSVFERIRSNVMPYAPTGLPESYEVVATRGKPPAYEKGPGKKTRTEALNYALDIIYWRRRLYGALLAVTLTLVASRFFLQWTADGVCSGAFCLLDPILRLLMNVLPDFIQPWFYALRQNPLWLWGFIAAFAFLFLLKQYLWTQTEIRAAEAWAVLKGKGKQPVWKPTFTSKLRQTSQSVFRKAISFTGASAVFILMLMMIVVLFSRTAFYLRNTVGTLCENTISTELTDSRSVTFDISNPCFNTGILMKKGETYQIEVDGSDWSDGGIKTGPMGFKSTPFLRFWVPIRRHIAEDWASLVGRIGNAGVEHFSIGAGITYKAKTSGSLFLYVNDAVFGLFPGRYWAWPYFWNWGRNKGTAAVTVSRVPDEE